MEVRDRIDKSAWSVGPWSSEPDEAEWIDEITGYKCLIKRSELTGALCGYVGIPTGHLLYGKYFTDRIEMLREDVQLHPQYGPITMLCELVDSESSGTISIAAAFKVHGNIGFADKFPQHDEWFFGFDCSHSEDLSPRMLMLPVVQEMNSIEWVYRDFDYVTNECQSLAEQLKHRE